MLEIWARILNALPGSRLMLKSAAMGSRAARDRVLAMMKDRGVDEDRLILVNRVPFQAAHVEMYNQVDIALDTFPYHGTTTTCEAMWMGVPVVTLAGRTHVSRVGVSLLTNVGLADLVADSDEHYVRIALDLAGDRTRLCELRNELRNRMQASPLMDGAAFARNIESMYRQIWRRWCEAR